jgi:hypothetical protein
LSPSIVEARISSGMSVLYEMPVDDNGVIRIGVDTDTGEPLRGRDTGFEQDILICEEKTEGNTSIIPRVIVEVKYGRVTTHDAIEVYPAGTLVSHGLPSSGYKKDNQTAVRRRILDDLGKIMNLCDDLLVAEDDADMLDSIVCVLSGADFLKEHVYFPDNQEEAEKEGWIWVRRQRVP